MKDDELVAVMVPRHRLTEVYALLGTEPPVQPMADPAVIQRAVQESQPDSKRFLDLLAASPGEWLSIGRIREELDLRPPELAGVLSTLPRRWRGRYRQSSPLPFEVEGRDEQRRYRMTQEVAEIVRSAPPTPTWNLEDFTLATQKEGGDGAVAVLEYGLDWAEKHSGDHDFGKGPYAPLYLRVPDHDGAKVKVLTTWGGRVGIMYKYLKKHPPFDDEAERRDLTLRLNEIDGISIPDGRWNASAYDVKSVVMQSPEARAAFFEIFDDVARRLSGASS